MSAITIMSATACSSDTDNFTGSTNAEVVGNIGDVCTLDDETLPNFSNYSSGEINVSHSAQCGSGVCLVHRFEGRASCPYGQSDPAHPECQTTGTSPEDVTVVVAPQLVDRPPSDATICSCRCAPPGGLAADAGGGFCDCPTGFECKELITFTPTDAAEELAGSYCVKQGTFVEDHSAFDDAERCDADLLNCEDR